MDFFVSNSKVYFDGNSTPMGFLRALLKNLAPPHEFDHDISVPSPVGQKFITTARIQPLSATAAAQMQQRGCCGGGDSATARNRRQLGGGAAAVAATRSAAVLCI